VVGDQRFHSSFSGADPRDTAISAFPLAERRLLRLAAKVVVSRRCGVGHAHPLTVPPVRPALDLMTVVSSPPPLRSPTGFGELFTAQRGFEGVVLRTTSVPLAPLRFFRWLTRFAVRVRALPSLREACTTRRPGFRRPSLLTQIDGGPRRNPSSDSQQQRKKKPTLRRGPPAFPAL